MPLLVKLVDAFFRDTLGRGRETVARIFGRGAFLRKITFFRFFLCLGISRFHPLRRNRRLIQCLYRAFDRISGLNISHTKPPFPEVLRSGHFSSFATTTSLPLAAEYSQVESVMSLSLYSAVTPVSYRASSLHVST